MIWSSWLGVLFLGQEESTSERLAKAGIGFGETFGGSANSGAPFTGHYGVYAEMIGIRVKVSESW